MSTFLCRWQPPSGWKAAKRSSGNCWIGESYIWSVRMPHRHAAIAVRRQGSDMMTHCRQERTSPTAQIPKQNQGCHGGFCANLETAYEICGLEAEGGRCWGGGVSRLFTRGEPRLGLRLR